MAIYFALRLYSPTLLYGVFLNNCLTIVYKIDLGEKILSFFLSSTIGLGFSENQLLADSKQLNSQNDNFRRGIGK